MDRRTPITKAAFYKDKTVVAVEWWIGVGSTPWEQFWSRLRVFSDGTADACWEEEGSLYGFDSRDYASYFFSEDEYRRVAIREAGEDRFRFRWDADDEQEYEIRANELRLPNWKDDPMQGFEYLGTY